jgi:hypothetical protein
METTGGGWPRSGARAIGVVYLLYFFTAFLGVFLMKGLVVSGDAAATAHGILAHEARYRSGFAVGLLANVLYIALTALFYGLFAPVSRVLSLVAAFLGLAGGAVLIGGGLLQIAPLVLLEHGPFTSAFGVDQVQAAALLCLALYARVYGIALVPFALYDLLLGYLIVKSAFLPRTLGVLMMLAGVGWVTFLWPPLAAALSAWVLPFGALAEIALMLWLLARGVNESAWREKAQRRPPEGA